MSGPARPTAGAGPAAAAVRSATFSELDVPTLYEILWLRSEVFVVEQGCAYRDLDGRDTQPSTRHLWVVDAADRIASYLRTVDEGRAITRIGRVVTAPTRRRQGLAGRLVRYAVARAPGVVVAAAQSHLADWYGRHGFVVDGPRFVEDGIEHVPMRRDPRPTERTGDG